MNPSTPRANKPMHNGKNSQTAAAPSQSNAPKDAPRNKITGVLANKVDASVLPMNRARALFAAASKRGATASGESMGSC